MTEEAIPPFEDSNRNRWKANGGLSRCEGHGAAGNITSPNREGDRKPNDTTEDKREREAKEVKEQEGGRRAKKGGGERERQEGEEHRKGQATA